MLFRALNDMFQDEYKLLKQLTPLSGPAMLANAYSQLLIPILKLFSTVLNQLIALVKKNLSKYNFLVLSAYDGLLSLQPHWDDLLARRGPEYSEEKNELRDGLLALRGLCLRSFPELLADIKLGATSRAVDTSTKVAEFMESVRVSPVLEKPTPNSGVQIVSYINGIPYVEGAIESALTTLGDGNWKMGEGVQVGTKQELQSESTILQRFIRRSFNTYRTDTDLLIVDDVVVTAITTATNISRTQRRPPFGSIFLFNNISYLRRHLLRDPQENAILSYISRPTEDTLNSNWRTAKAGYFDANFSPLMQAITDDPKDKNKGAGKEKFTRFFDLFDELMERHRFVRFMEDDEEGKAEVGEEVVMLVVPSFQRFVQKQKDKEFSKSTFPSSSMRITDQP